jgi:large subunit ribosomal protein L21
MYAVIETGGKQYRVEVGTELEVELLDAEPGQALTLDRVLLVADGDDTAIGRPVVADARVDAEVLRQDRGEKLIVYKYRPKARRRVKKGHRQGLTVLKITDVRIGSRSAAEAARKAERDAKTERQRLEEAAARQAAEDAALAAKLASKAKAEGGATEPKGRGAAKTRRSTRAKADEAEPQGRRGARASRTGAATAPGEAEGTEPGEAGSEAPPKRGRAKATEPESKATAGKDEPTPEATDQGSARRSRSRKSK